MGNKIKCEVPTCKREAQTKRYGNLCLLHYKRKHKTGTTRQTYRVRLARDLKCRHCDKKVGKTGAKGLCNRHYQMWRNHNGDALYFDKKKIRLEITGYARRINGRAAHQVVMENYIKRPLRKGEVVHHINGDKLDNSEQNLYLCKNRSEHSSIHKQLEYVAMQLVRSGHIKFKDGIYELSFK